MKRAIAASILALSGILFSAPAEARKEGAAV
jgi:hypothetical protein